MTTNRFLHQAKRQKNDEFYTQLADIENELRHYKAHFRDKVVYLNCDDPYESNFFKYFALNFNELGLKKLLATSYAGSSVAGEQLALHLAPAYKTEITRVDDLSGDGATGLSDVRLLLESDPSAVTQLEGDGDFRSAECIELLEEADVVVTNPPFSLFREYVAQLIDHGKQFLILGQQNAITYKEIFPLLKDGKMWLGNDNGGEKWFRVPMDYEIKTESRKKIDDGAKYFSMGSVNWYTNLDHRKRHEEMILVKRYRPEDYPTYDNYDAIDVSRVANIPRDHDGPMGVPITFLDKHNPEQFRIVKFRKGDDDRDLRVNGKEPYFRIVIQRRGR